MEQISGDQAKPFIEQRFRCRDGGGTAVSRRDMGAVDAYLKTRRCRTMLRTKAREIVVVECLPVPSPEKAPPGLQDGPDVALEDRTDPGVLFLPIGQKPPQAVFPYGKEVCNQQAVPKPERFGSKHGGLASQWDIGMVERRQREHDRLGFMSWSALEAC